MFLFLLLLFVGCSQLRSSIYLVESGNNERNETSILQQRYRDGAHCTQRHYFRRHHYLQQQSRLEGEEMIYFVGCLHRTPSWTCVLRWTNSWYGALLLLVVVLPVMLPLP